MRDRDVDLDGFKRAAAERAVAAVSSGMTVGLGSGTTAEFALAALAARIGRGLRIAGVPTSERIAELAHRHGIPLVPLDGRPIDIAIDGADEIERGTLNLIKGGGGSLVREKLVVRASRRFVVIADESKLVDRLGARVQLPVALLPFARALVLHHLDSLGTGAAVRQADGRDFVTDDGLLIADCSCTAIADPAALAARLAAVPGVVDCGLFLGFTAQAVIAGAAGVEVIAPTPRGAKPQ
ncbi:MAG: ribose-5-phosphate isomerase RpiA [Alphaproteobacteria bacterium]|nr:ribose-5-phosphate isomerase RpiA [Alphaproteobacteria bacterium]